MPALPMTLVAAPPGAALLQERGEEKRRDVKSSRQSGWGEGTTTGELRVKRRGNVAPIPPESACPTRSGEPALEEAPTVPATTKGFAPGKGTKPGGRAVRPTANSTSNQKAVHSRSHVPSSRKASELTIEAVYAARSTTRSWGNRGSAQGDQLPDEGERARLIGEITRLIREPLMPETTRTAGLTLIGWLARRMPGEAPHALGVAEARQSERRLRAGQRKR